MTESRFGSWIQQYSIYFAWVVSIVAVGGSLYFSEVMHFVPCKLCWYQRIFMYPQVILLAIASYRDDRSIIPYLLPINVIGGLIALYHYLHQKVPALYNVMPCTQGVPCNEDYINWLGFITIPLLALIAFVLITLFLICGKNAREN